MASGASDLLANAVVCDSFEEALQGCHLVLGTTARERKIQHEFINAREAGQLAVNESGQQQIALVFGRERTGLTNDEAGLCHKLVNIPTNPDYRSLNVASAIQIVSYEVMMSLADCQSNDDHHSIEYASSDNMQRYYQHLEETLIDIDFLKVKQSPQLMSKLRHIYNRVRLTEEELNILRGILSKTQKTKRN